MIPFYGLVLIGGIFILIGFIVKAFPDSIAGYNTMSAEKKKNVDIEGLSTLGRNCMIIAGVLTIVLPSFFRLIQLKINEGLLLIEIPFAMVLVLLILSQKYDHNKKSTLEKLFPFVLVLGIFVFVGLKMFKNHDPLEVSITNNQITISGDYGLTAPVNEIGLIEGIPEIKRRTGGYSDGIVRKGNFLLEEWGGCKLFLQSQGGPYIKVSTSDKPILINGKSADDTRKLYDKLRMETK